MGKMDLASHGWEIIGELSAGDTEVVLADHPAAEGIDRTFVRDCMALSFLISPQHNPSRGCFVAGLKADTELHVSMGNIVFIPPHTPIHVRADAVPPRRLLTCNMPIRYDMEAFDQAVRLERCLNIRNGSVRSALLRMVSELMEPGFASGAVIEGLGIYLGGELAGFLAKGGHEVRSGGLAPWQLRRIDEYLLAGHWDCRISDLATLCGISTRHLMRAFRQSMDRSLAEYIATLRADRARALLRDETLSIAEIARELRFSRPAGFTTAFRRLTGLTPSAYRQFQRGLL
ncbi:hypothetical protein MB02_15795 [Croceicoccus estronivorus]|uniref:helix-turn-helix transcriptional regulator n=1 Tax=Croceicoccus estronivorus TaxID=1172626 RepID=UPI0008362F99|nr:helix-turn-helix transcriptional regulator [Croceicoccus estronivorus]OCC22590.1 hypothetical protein MB02_15795 [Croceicoccus estronivorus]